MNLDFSAMQHFLPCRWLLLVVLLGAADMPGHGGPIRAVAAGDGHVVSGSFDGSAIVWPQGVVLRGHEGAVNAVAVLADGRVATGGADGTLRLTRPGGDTTILKGHTGPISAIAVSGTRLATASWDGTARIWAKDGTSRVLQGHAGPLNAVAFAPPGSAWGELVTAGYDGTLRFWAADGSSYALPLGPPQNALAVAPPGSNWGEVAAAGADGVLRLLGPNGAERDMAVDTVPLTGLALSPDGTKAVVVSIGGSAMVVDLASLQVMTVLLGMERPLWAVAWDGDVIVTGGAGRVLRRWDATTGRARGTLGSTTADPVIATGDRGAAMFRACSACHTLGPDDGRHAGPSLQAIFGRKIGSVPGYNYSAALHGPNIVWTPETVSLLFEHGPHALLPGTKMPEQVLADPEDRAALMRFLSQAR